MLATWSAKPAAAAITAVMPAADRAISACTIGCRAWSSVIECSLVKVED